jgi:serine/threonine-protein kinase
VDPNHGPYLVTEYLVGEDLATRLAREPAMRPRLAVHVAEQMARGLGRAHAAGVIHRDVKPANVFLTLGEDDALVAKLLDFGVSKLHSRDATSITGMGMAVGTPRYMSPEQIEGTEDVDARTDVWSLSAVLYEMLAGRPAFLDEATPIAVMLRVLRGPPDPLGQVAPWVKPRLAEIVEAGLARDRDERISDATTFAQLLIEAMPEAFLDGARRTTPRLSTIPAPCAFDDGRDDAPPPTSDVNVAGRLAGHPGHAPPKRRGMKA